MEAVSVDGHDAARVIRLCSFDQHYGKRANAWMATHTALREVWAGIKRADGRIGDFPHKPNLRHGLSPRPPLQPAFIVPPKPHENGSGNYNSDEENCSHMC